MQATKPTKKRTGHLGMLDAMRFVAALSVLAFHYTARQSPGWDGFPPDELAGVGQWAAYGRMGVPLFFVISGFVLLMSSWGKDVSSFVASRVGRLFPAFWVAVAFSVVLVVKIWPENPAYLGHKVTTSGALLNFTMLNSAYSVPDIDGPYWTLWYEARFYALIAVLILVGITRNRILAFCALWPIVGAMAASTHSEMLIALLMPDYAPFFAGGMLLYLIYRDGHDLGVWLLIGMQAAFALNFSINTYSYALPLETEWVPSKPVIALVTAACFGLVALVTLTPVARWNMRWMAFAGALTYPVYLLHENLGWYVIHLMHGEVTPWTAVACATGVTLVAALLLHQLVEKPFGNKLRLVVLGMLQRQSRDEAAAAAAVATAPPVAAALPVAAAVPEPAATHVAAAPVVRPVVARHRRVRISSVRNHVVDHGHESPADVPSPTWQDTSVDVPSPIWQGTSVDVPSPTWQDTAAPAREPATQEIPAPRSARLPLPSAGPDGSPARGTRRSAPAERVAQPR
jgi:peptidoglycan/LPS O-acetylase OafA/YrhL